MKFSVVVADPPYRFSDTLKMSSVKRGAEANYDTMGIEDICNLPVKQIADPNGSVLALWVPASLLSDGLKVMESWGYKQKQVYCWVKIKQKHSLLRMVEDIFPPVFNNKWISPTLDSIQWLFSNAMLTIGMGRLFRQSHEICLIGTNNNGIYKQLENRSQRSVSFGQNLKHSAKPEHLQDSLDLMFPPPKDGTINRVELFARRERKGWLTLGNECHSSMNEDIKVSLEKLING